jgi:uncharacterized protein (TIGR00106 family)
MPGQKENESDSGDYALVFLHSQSHPDKGGKVAVVQVTVVPIGTGDTSLSKHVAAALKPLDKSGLKYELTSMATNIEGDLGQVMRVIMEMHETPFRAGVKRVLTRITIDDRRDKGVTIEGKKKSVLSKR